MTRCEGCPVRDLERCAALDRGAAALCRAVALAKPGYAGLVRRLTLGPPTARSFASAPAKPLERLAAVRACPHRGPILRPG